MKKNIRITVSAAKANQLKEQAYWEEVIHQLEIRKKNIEKRIARLRKKIPASTLETFEQHRKTEEREKLAKATAVIYKALQDKKL